MKTLPPTLSPLLRSNSQGLLLAELYLNPEREHSITQLAAASATALPTALREVDRLQLAGFVLGRKLGQTRLIQANVDHPMFTQVRDLVLFAYGPVAVLTPLVQEVSGLKQAFIYGSWAARISGEPGADPGDIDVLFIGDVSSRQASEVGTKATKIMGREVHVHNLSEVSWNSEDSGFVKTVKSRPMIQLHLA